MIQIAFCDDDQTVLDQLSALLEKYRAQRCVQIQCTAFHSPLDLLAEIEKGTRYDILFLDVIMPAENGITAAKVDSCTIRVTGTKTALPPPGRSGSTITSSRSSFSLLPPSLQWNPMWWVPISTSSSPSGRTAFSV